MDRREFTRYGVTYRPAEDFGNGEFWTATHETEGVFVTRKVWIPGHYLNDQHTNTPVGKIIEAFDD